MGAGLITTLPNNRRGADALLFRHRGTVASVFGLSIGGEKSRLGQRRSAIQRRMKETRTSTTWADIATKFPFAEAKWRATGPAYTEIGLEITQREGFPAELYAIEAHTRSPRRWWLGPSGWIHQGRVLSELRPFAKPQFYPKPTALQFYSVYGSPDAEPQPQFYWDSKPAALQFYPSTVPKFKEPKLFPSFPSFMYDPYDPSRFQPDTYLHLDKPSERELSDVYEELKGIVARMPVPVLVTSSYSKSFGEDRGEWYDAWRSPGDTPRYSRNPSEVYYPDRSSDYCSSDLPTEASRVKASSKDTKEDAAHTNNEWPAE